jgi:hypothetical protein
MNSPTIDHTSNRNSTKHPVRTCLYGNWNILITFTRHQNVQLRQRTFMTYRFCFFYFQRRSLLLFSNFLAKLCFQSSFQTNLKGCMLIRKLGLFQWKSDQSFVKFNNHFPSANFWCFFSFLADRSKCNANSPENNPPNLIRQPLKLFISEDIRDSRTFTLNQIFRFCIVRTLYKMWSTHKIFAQAIYPLRKLIIAETIN